MWVLFISLLKIPQEHPAFGVHIIHFTTAFQYFYGEKDAVFVKRAYHVRVYAFLKNARSFIEKSAKKAVRNSYSLKRAYHVRVHAFFDKIFAERKGRNYNPSAIILDT